MKVLMVTEWYPEDEGERFTGGVEARTYYVSRELVKLGHEVMVICRRRKSAGEWHPGGVKVVRCGKPGGEVVVDLKSALGRLVFAVAATLAGLREDCDLVEGTNYSTYISAWVIGRLKRVPVVAWWPDVLIGRWKGLFGLVGALWEMVERISLALPWSVVIPISNTTGQLLEERGVEKGRIYPVYLGVDWRSISSVKVKKSKRRRIITVARLVGYKKVGGLIKAMGLIREKSKKQGEKKLGEVELVIVGEGPERRNLDRLVKDLKLGGAVKFYENVEKEKLMKLLKESRVFCLPSEVEGFGLVLLEAMAAGLPYVATDIPAVREITKGGRGGFLYPVGDVEELAERLMRLLDDEKLYMRKVGEGRELVKEYSWEKCARETAEVYEKVLNFEAKKAKLKAKSYS
jgi:glycosyltransferase involved in cell wall biosynthesis